MIRLTVFTAADFKIVAKSLKVLMVKLDTNDMEVDLTELKPCVE